MSFSFRAYLGHTFKTTNNVNSTSLSAPSFCLIIEVLDVMLARNGRWEG
jgi:hypothetical protein